MKIHALVFAFTVLCLSPLCAQTPPDPTAPATTAADAVSQGAPTPALPRNIMPQSLNHKPNPTKPPAEIAAKIDKFFKGLEAGDYPGAYEGFLGGTRLGAQKEKMSVFISKTEDAFGIYGKLNDYEIFDNYGVGSNVLVLTYLSRHQIQPLRWRFIFYRADNNWDLINMGFDDVLLEMLD
jgi:hypothetical protein